jgi:hypothetical protein
MATLTIFILINQILIKYLLVLLYLCIDKQAFEGIICSYSI